MSIDPLPLKLLRQCNCTTHLFRLSYVHTRWKAAGWLTAHRSPRCRVSPRNRRSHPCIHHDGALVPGLQSQRTGCCGPGCAVGRATNVDDAVGKELAIHPCGCAGTCCLRRGCRACNGRARTCGRQKSGRPVCWADRCLGRRESGPPRFVIFEGISSHRAISMPGRASAFPA